jgi:hypothetical protein
MQGEGLGFLNQVQTGPPAGQPDISEWFNYDFSEETFIHFINQQVIKY